MTANILIVDNDEQIQRLLSRMLKGNGYNLTMASSAEAARELLKNQKVELILCDIGLPGESGLDFIRFALAEYPHTAAVMVTGLGSTTFAQKALEIGVYGYITKPFEQDIVLFSVASALRRRELVIANRTYRQDLEKMVAKRTATLEETNKRLRQEIAERKRARDVLKANEQKYRLLISNIPGFVYKGYKDWSVDFIDNKVGELTGYDKEAFDARRLKWSDLIYKEDIEAVKKCVVEALNAGDAYIREYRIKTKADKTLWMQDRGQVVRRQTGEIDYFSGVFFDITKQKQAEEALLQSEEKHRLLVNNASDAIFIAQDEIIKFANPKTEEISGYSAKELAQIPLVNFIHPDDRNMVLERYKKRLKGEKISDTYSFRFLNKTGQEVWVQPKTTSIAWEGKPAALTFLRDISELKQAEEERKQIETQLVQSEKMASIGQLAAGVAHEINNPTGFVSSNLKTLSDYIKDISDLTKEYRNLVAELKENTDSCGSRPDISGQVQRITSLEEDIDVDFILKDILELIEESREGVERIKHIIQDLKDFAHPGEDKPKFTNINQNLDSTVNVVWNELKYKAEVTRDYGDLPEVRCYPQMLNQVFMNLLVNAAQAIEKRGEIRIQTRADNGYVEIKISDTGCGIPKKNLPRIFDPFFTTKDVGKGTGLGLNVAYNIIKKHHGEIDVKSDVGKGTTVTIKIPTEQLSAEGE